MNVLMLAAMLGAVATTDYTWVSTNAYVTTDKWGATNTLGQCTNWRTASGDIPTVAPTNAADNFAIKLPMVWTYDTPAWKWGYRTDKIISTGPNAGRGSGSYFGGGAVDPYLYSISGVNAEDSNRYILYHAPYPNDQFVFPFQRVFSVRDPNDFYGIFRTDNANATWELRAESDFVPVMHALDSKYGPRVRVPTAGTTAKIEAMSRKGSLYKDGAGTLEVAGGSQSHYVVSGGALRLNGAGASDAALLETLFDEALLHLDASDAASMVISNADDHAWIDRWNDVRGNGIYAYNARPGSWNPAYVSAARSLTDLPLADFGDKNSSVASEQWSAMQLSTSWDSVRDAVVVVSYPYSQLTTFSTVLGHTSKYYFMSDNTYARVITCAYDPHYVDYGRFTVNGEPKVMDDLLEYASKWKQVNVLHMQTIGATSVNLLGCDRYIETNRGGMRVGEVLLFDRVLTAEERTAVDRYLVKKWIDGEDRAASGVLLKADTSIDVAAGNVARVDGVASEGASVVKTGEGVLEVKAVQPNQSFTVNGGGVRFAAAEVSTSTVGGTPTFWLDATRDDTMTMEEGTVREWCDCRDGVSAKAVACSTATGTPTTLDLLWPHKATGPNNLQVLDLGVGANRSGTQCGFSLNPNAENTTYAGFMVLKFNTAAHYLMFGASNNNIAFLRQTGRIGGSDENGNGYLQREVTAAYWSINGQQVDPRPQLDILQQTTDYFVIAFNSAVPIHCNAIAMERGADTAGNLKVGEFILYNAPITFAEFKQTEAYLMQKWLNKTHPANAAEVGELAFASGVDRVIDTDRDLTVQSVSGGNNAIVKRGSGAASVTLTDLTANQAISLEGGSVDVNTVDAEFLKDAVFHLDPSDNSTLTYTVDGNGTTNLLYIADVRNNGIQAHSVLGIDKVASTNPVLKRVETKPGVWRQVMDFQQCCYTTNQSAKWPCAGLQLEKNGVYTPQTGIREVFLVVAQNKDTDGYQVNSMFCADTSTALKWGRQHGTAAASGNPLISSFYDKSTPPQMVYIYKGFYQSATSAHIDGVANYATNAFLSVSDGYKLVELVPGEDGQIGLISMERFNYMAGGYTFGEIIAFPYELTEAQRSYLRAKLRAKWFADTPTPSKPSLQSLAVKAGSTVNYNGDALSPIPITVTVPKKMAAGSYTLLSSSAGLSGTAEDWKSQITIDNDSCRLADIVIEGNSVILNLVNRGLVIFFE